MTFPLQEPQRGKDLLLRANESFVGNDVLVALAPILADGIVLTYPILLIVWYVWGIRQKEDTYKYGALYVASCAVGVSILAHAIQLLVDKSRPEGYIGNTDMLIMEHLPTAPFPSDHASVGFAVGMSTLLWANKHDKKLLKIVGLVLLVGAGIMSATRVGVGIHWPTDVLMGGLLGIFVAWAFLQGNIWNLGEVYVYKPLVRLQKRLFSKVGIEG